MKSATGKSQESRRSFISKSAAGASALAGFSVLRNGYGANYDTIKIGVVGCGGRGTGAVRDAVTAAPNVELVSMADIHQSQIEKSIARLKKFKTRDKKNLPGISNIRPDKCFTGLDAYKKVIDSGIDYVLLCTPPGFRPDHIEYSVKKGIHIFAEKPCATDAPGIRKIMDLIPEIERKGLGLLAGFNSRHIFHYQDAVKAVQDGKIGKVMSLHCYFNTRNIWYRDKEPGMTEPEYWFYNWFHVDWLCGDHIVEQHVHNLDRCNWFMDAHPVKAYGMGGRQYHTERGGNIYDHFAVEYEYPDGTRMTSMCRQIVDTDTRIGEFIVGDKGTVTMLGGHDVNITGPNAAVLEEYPEQNESHMQEHRDFITDLRKGKIANDTRILCEGSMTAILGREAAYTGKVITWDDMMKSNMKLTPDDIAKWDGSLRPVPKPGMKRG
jgi:myo-inositol 2-dehydrogenase / D-chiro-inositol 1-dehydrogenase